tara:strand:- start:243010 stop:243525 length:516 start_codon:yes stop_codon:yes gene_type:complete
MSIVFLRRAAVWLVAGLLVSFVFLQVGSNIGSILATRGLLAELESTQSQLDIRLARAAARNNELRGAWQGRTLIAPDAAIAARDLEGQLRAGFSAGVLLSVLVQADEESDIVTAHILWRGREADMRASFERLVEALPYAIVHELDVHGVDEAGVEAVELSAQLVQAWELDR